MTDVVPVFLVELVVLNLAERLPPEYKSLLYRQAKDLDCHLQFERSDYQLRMCMHTFRNKPYCKRPKCFRCLSRLKHICRLRMHAGKCLNASSSIMSAVIASPDAAVAPLHSEETPARKPLDKLSRMGTIRVSSSSRGRALAVIYKVIREWPSVVSNFDEVPTSKSFSRRDWNSCVTMLTCSAAGT